MIYEERLAPPGLEGIITRAWYLRTPPARPYEKILPLPFVHLIVNLSEPYRLFGAEGDSTEVSDAFLSGLQSEYLVIADPPLLHHVGVELTPAGMHALTPRRAAAAGAVQDARAVFEGIDALVETLRLAPNPGQAVEVMLDFVVAARAADPDELVTEALQVLSAHPDSPIGGIAERLGTTHSALTRRFRRVTGVSPKQHAQVLRFHRFIDAVTREQGTPDWARLAAAGGYYDQPHVIRAFRRFSGWTPAEYHRLAVEHGPDAAHFVPLDQVPHQARS